MINDYAVSLIRTWIPAGVGAGLTWLATLFGVVLPKNASDGAVAVSVLIVTGAYYTLVRLLEKRWPKLGVLLGSAKAPAYAKPAAVEPAHKAGSADTGADTAV